MKNFLLKIRNNKNFEKWCVAFFISCIHLLIFGYQFNCGDQAEHLPQVYQKLNPTLYPNDFFLTLYNQTFTVRFYWVEIVTFFSFLLPVSVICFSLYFICSVLCIYAWIKIAEHFSANKISNYIAVVFIFILFDKFTVGGNSLGGNMFVSSNPAEVFASFGILFFIENKTIKAAIFFAVASLFQVLIGFQLWIIFSVLLLFDQKKINIKKVFIFSLIYLSASTPIIFPLLQRQLFLHEHFDQTWYYQTVYVFRSVLHFKPSLFSVTDYIKLLLLIVPAVLILRGLNFKEARLIKIFFSTVIFGAILYTILMEGFNLNSIGKIQWFKTTVWLNAFCCVILAVWIGNYLSKFNFSFDLNPSYLLALSVIVLLVISNSKFLPYEKLTHRYQFGNYNVTDLQIVHEWIKNNSPVNAVFLVSPKNDAFACEAQRSQPVNFKAVVHEPFYFIQWYKRMQDYYQVDFEKVGNNSAIFQAENNYQNAISYPSNNEAQYRIDNINQCKVIEKLGKVIFKKGDWMVTEIK